MLNQLCRSAAAYSLGCGIRWDSRFDRAKQRRQFPYDRGRGSRPCCHPGTVTPCRALLPQCGRLPQQYSVGGRWNRVSSRMARQVEIRIPPTATPCRALLPLCGGLPPQYSVGGCWNGEGRKFPPGLLCKSWPLLEGRQCARTDLPELLRNRRTRVWLGLVGRADP